MFIAHVCQPSQVQAVGCFYAVPYSTLLCCYFFCRCGGGHGEAGFIGRGNSLHFCVIFVWCERFGFGSLLHVDSAVIIR